MLPIGTRLGRYEVQSPLGAGGMGEVYRARDTELHRDVAIKVLPEQFGTDADRLARFKREAQVLASLNHPNIAAIYGIEEGAGARALVLELVEGPTLADRIAQGPVPLDEAILIARQIADALEFAHDQGVIHRDLKPANVKLRPDGAVKVLDFGLAKALDPVTPAADVSQSPTVTSPAMTRMGMILGTATYMAPEQARGRVVDKRADIWAYGCVLFEMLTGRRAFEGDDVAETIGAVIHKEPSWSALPVDTPGYLSTLLRRCLQKDLKRRLPHIGIARIEIDEGGAEAAEVTPATTAPRRLWASVHLAWFVAALATAATITLSYTLYLRSGTAFTAAVTRASILPPENVAVAIETPGLRFMLSPDGQKLAFQGRDAAGRTSLWVRPIEALTWQPLAGTEGVVIATWSPDSRSLAFVANGRLRRIDASGGPAITLADQATNTGLAWSAEDVILFSPDRGALFRVSASGGSPSRVTTLDTDVGETGHWHPFFLPDNRHFVYAAVGSTTAPADDRAVYIGSLDSAEKPRMLLQDGGANPKYASGHLLFMRDTTLMAQPLDPDRLELSGEAIPLADQIQVGGSTGSNGAFSVSHTGVIVYQAGSVNTHSQLNWYERSGKPVGTLGEPAEQGSIELSPDGTRVLASLWDSTRRARDLWIYDVRRGLRTRFTFDPADEAIGVWSPDSRRVVFNSSRRRGFMDLYHKASSGVGSEEVFVSDDQNKEPHSWSENGDVIVYNAGGAGSSQDLWTVPFSGDRKPAIFLRTEFVETRPRVSPDGRWLAYYSNESGRPEIYVTTLTDRSGKWQVSTTGGNFPRWRHDGSELFYLSLDNVLMAAAVDGAGVAFQVGEVKRLFEIRPRTGGAGLGGAGYPYDVSGDGQRFLVNTLLDEASIEPLTLLINWPALFR